MYVSFYLCLWTAHNNNMKPCRDGGWINCSRNLPFCIYYDLLLPSMSFQCTTVYFCLRNLNTIHVSKCSRIASHVRSFARTRGNKNLKCIVSRFSFCFSFCWVFIHFCTQMRTHHVHIKMQLWATDIGFKCSFYIFADQLQIYDMPVFVRIQVYLFSLLE